MTSVSLTLAVFRTVEVYNTLVTKPVLFLSEELQMISKLLISKLLGGFIRSDRIVPEAQSCSEPNADILEAKTGHFKNFVRKLSTNLHPLGHSLSAKTQ